jgi:predicted RNA-binding protein
MCETNAYVREKGEDQLFLENVDILKPEEGRIYLRNLFGEEKHFEGSLEEISLTKHKIILQKK